MACIEIKTKKYQTRKGPPYHAKDCKGLVKKGNDGKEYISAADKKGIYKWIIKGARVTQKKKGVKTYKMIDNGGEPGDALVKIEGTSWRVGPSSTIIGALIWNCLLTECVQRLQASGAPIPVFASLNMPGAKEHNARLMDKWQELNPHL